MSKIRNMIIPLALLSGASNCFAGDWGIEHYNDMMKETHQYLDDLELKQGCGVQGGFGRQETFRCVVVYPSTPQLNQIGLVCQDNHDETLRHEVWLYRNGPTGQRWNVTMQCMDGWKILSAQAVGEGVFSTYKVR